MVSLLSLSGCISCLSNHFTISNNYKNKKAYLVEYTTFLTLLGYLFSNLCLSQLFQAILFAILLEVQYVAVELKSKEMKLIHILEQAIELLYIKLLH